MEHMEDMLCHTPFAKYLPGSAGLTFCWHLLYGPDKAFSTGFQLIAKPCRSVHWWFLPVFMFHVKRYHSVRYQNVSALPIPGMNRASSTRSLPRGVSVW